MELDKFYEMLETEFNKYVNDLPTREDVIRHAYWIACFNEILDFFGSMDEYDWDETWKEIVGDNPSTTTLNDIMDDYLDFSHPEYYNLFCYEGLCDIIKEHFRWKAIREGQRK